MVTYITVVGVDIRNNYWLYGYYKRLVISGIKGRGEKVTHRVPCKM